MARTSIFQNLRNRDELQNQQKTPVPAARSYVNRYEDKLRLIGAHIDKSEMRRVQIMEVPGGMLVRASASDNVSDELMEFPDELFEQHHLNAVTQRGRKRSDFFRIKTDLIPTSYSDVLRTMGAWLDQSMARSIFISEGSEGIFVTGLRLLETSDQSRYAQFDEIFTPEAVDLMLTDAYALRRSRS